MASHCAATGTVAQPHRSPTVHEMAFPGGAGVQEAEELIVKADKKLKGGFMTAVFGSGNKKEEACDLLTEAANKFKIAKLWARCGGCHKRVAEVQLELNDKFAAAASFQAAFQAYKQDDGASGTAVECLNQAIELHINNGRFTQAAKFHKEAGELFEKELNYAKAVEHFQQGGEYYKTEDQTSSANQCFLRVAVLSAELQNYSMAIDVFEQVASSSLDVALLKWSVKVRACARHPCMWPMHLHAFP